ncbi:MAG: hypothetical protein U5K53_09695 [Halanaerobiales bacterium]|nr:hypothetical protein [Halanaerobiales bacterium]
MIKILIFSLSSYYLSNYLKERKVSYLFIGSLINAIFYILEPVIIFLMPFYASIFYFSCNNYCSKKRLSQLFVFVFPTIAAAFSLSYISWIYGRGFRFIYLNGNLFGTAVEYSGNVNNIFSFLTNFSTKLLFCILAYIFMLIWIIYKKGAAEPFIYLYLMPIFLYVAKQILENYNADLIFYSLYLFFGLFYFILFKTEMNIFTKLVFYLVLVFNFFYLIYNLYPSLFFITEHIS